MITPFPLCWPFGWKRTHRVQRSHRQPFKGATFARGRDRLRLELERLGAVDPILSTNMPLRMDGQPHGGRHESGVDDPAVAVYFTLNGKQMVLARDEYDGIAENVTSLALAIEYLRGLRRHGGATMMEMAFSGFAALPAPGARDCWVVLGIDRPQTHLTGNLAIIEAAYRSRAKVVHPDVGGKAEDFYELNRAREEAQREVQA